MSLFDAPFEIVELRGDGLQRLDDLPADGRERIGRTPTVPKKQEDRAQRDDDERHRSHENHQPGDPMPVRRLNQAFPQTGPLTLILHAASFGPTSARAGGMTMRIRTAALLVLPFALAACTTAAPIAGPQTSAGHTRTYPGVSPAQVYAAAERLF